MKFKLGCYLDYNISSSSTFIFNIRILANEYQRILEQNLSADSTDKIQETSPAELLLDVIPYLYPSQKFFIKC